jgi:hypothetical protein
MQACSAAWCMQQIEHASLHLNMQSKQALLLLLGRTHTLYADTPITTSGVIRI